jgi:large subunit ribosomal protein L25
MEATLQAQRRTDRGKNEARRHRAAGRLPGVVYGPVSGGGSDTAISVTVDPKVLSRILHSESGQNTIISLELEGKKTPVLVKDFLLDPINHALLHADFYRVAMDRKLVVTVPVTVKGEPKGVKQQGGVLDFVTRQFEIEVLPSDIPESVEVDVSELLIGQGIRLRDIAQGVKWTPVSDTDTMLVHVVAIKVVEETPVAAAEAAPAAGAAPAEPEVIKKGKTDKPEKEEGKS